MRFLPLFLSCIVAAAPVLAAPADDALFRQISEREYAWARADGGGGEDDQRIAPHLQDVRPAAQAKRLAYLQQVLAELDAIKPASLSPEAAVDYAVYRFDIENRVTSLKFRDYEMPVNSDSSFWSELGYTARAPFKTEADYRNWLNQLHEIPTYFAEQVANMRAGEARGFTPPQVTLAGRDQSVAQVAEAKTVEDSFLYLPFKEMPASIAEERRAALRAEARKTIEQEDLPAYRTLLAFLRGDYIPKNLLAPLDYKAMGASSQKAIEDKYLPGTLAGASGPVLRAFLKAFQARERLASRIAWTVATSPSIAAT